MDSSLILGVSILVIGTAWGTYLIHVSNRKANTKRIEMLEQTFTNQNNELKRQSEEIKSLTDRVDSNLELVKGISNETNNIASDVLNTADKLDKTTTSISEISQSIKALSESSNEITRLINDEIREKGTLKLIIPKHPRYTFAIGSNVWNISREELEQGLQITVPNANIRLPVTLKIKEDELFVWTELRSRTAHLMVFIAENNWGLNKGENFSINFDDKGLEVIDTMGFVLFQINLVNNLLSIHLIQFTPTGVVFVTQRGIHTVPYDDENYAAKYGRYAAQTLAIFKHHGAGYLGKRSDSQ